MNEQITFGFWSTPRYCIRQYFRDSNSLKLQRHLKLTKVSGGILVLLSFWLHGLFYLFYFIANCF